MLKNKKINYIAIDSNHNNVAYHIEYHEQTTRGAIGMPLCVQVIGQPWNEELVLNVMKTLQSAIRKSSSCKIEK